MAGKGKKRPNPNRRQVVVIAESVGLTITIKVSPWQAKMIEAEDWEGARSVFIQALKKFQKEYPNYSWEFLNEENCSLKVKIRIKPPTPKLKKSEPVQLSLFES